MISAELRAVTTALDIVIRALEIEAELEPSNDVVEALAVCHARRDWIAEILIMRSDMSR